MAFYLIEACAVVLVAHHEPGNRKTALGDARLAGLVFLTRGGCLAQKGNPPCAFAAIPSSKLRQSVSAISVFASMRTKGLQGVVDVAVRQPSTAHCGFGHGFGQASDLQLRRHGLIAMRHGQTAPVSLAVHRHASDRRCLNALRRLCCMVATL